MHWDTSEFDSYYSTLEFPFHSALENKQDEKASKFLWVLAISKIVLLEEEMLVVQIGVRVVARTKEYPSNLYNEQ